MMKIVITYFALLFAVTVNAQPGWYAVFPGDTVKLVLNSPTGTIQWQESNDSLNWSDISGFTNPVEVFIVSTSPTNKKYYRAKLTNSAVCENSSWYSNVVMHKILSSTSGIVEGDWYRGGIVFSHDGSGSGLIAPQDNQITGGNDWGCSGTSITGATSNTNGAANTAAILAACAVRPISASVCDTLTWQGETDWYLPAFNQLSTMYNKKNLLDNIISATYISSTEYSATHAYGVNFFNGFGYWYSKSTGGNVRCIRSFSTSYNAAYLINNVSATEPLSVSVTSQPQSYNLCVGADVIFTVAANGTSPITYQWKKDGTDIPGAVNPVYAINQSTLIDEGVYTCEITNLCATVISNNAILNLINISVDAGNDFIFCADTSYVMISSASSNHSVESGILQYAWSPSAGLNDASVLSPTAYLTGNVCYSLTVTDQLGCSASDAVTFTSNTPVVIGTHPVSYNKCLNSNVGFSVFATGTSPLVYMWKKNGFVIGGADSDSYSVNGLQISDEADYVCEVSNYCNTAISDIAHLNVIEMIANAGSDVEICNGNDTILNASSYSNHPALSGTISYTWSPSTGLSGTGIYNPVASPNSTTDYTVIVSDQYNCTAGDIVTVFVQKPYDQEEICIVTVDTLTWKNKIIWEKTANTGTIGYNVYKEVATNVYSGIGYIPFNDPAVFTDVSSMPESYANRYKITVVDKCGAESDKSFYHMTMNLTIAANGSTMGLNWSHYIDNSGNFVPPLYYIYRGTNPSNMTLLTTVPGTVNSYNDVNIFDVYYYIVGVEKTDGCDPAKIPVYSFSNKKDNSSLVGINDIKTSCGTILIFPNPVTTSATLTIPNFGFRISKSETGTSSDFVLRISDLTGKVVRIVPINELNNHQITPSSNLQIEQSSNHQIKQSSNHQIKIERGNLKPGVYFVELKADRIYRGKLVVE